MLLLLHAYFTNAGSCWWVHFTGMQHFLKQSDHFFWSGFIWLLTLSYLLPSTTGTVLQYIVITGNRGWSYWVLCQRGVLLVHLRSYPKWTIHIFLGAPVWGDSESSGPLFVPFLIRWENTKYPRKVDSWQWNIWPPPIWMVQLVPRPIFQGDSESEDGNLWSGL